jgi:hypothetical protein
MIGNPDDNTPFIGEDVLALFDENDRAIMTGDDRDRFIFMFLSFRDRHEDFRYLPFSERSHQPAQAMFPIVQVALARYRETVRS